LYGRLFLSDANVKFYHTINYRIFLYTNNFYFLLLGKGAGTP